MRRHLHPLQLEQLGRLMHHLAPNYVELLDGWWNSLDKTADRAVLLLCTDIEVAVEMINTEPNTTFLFPGERVKQLMQFATSEGYFQLRKRLRLTIK